MNRLFRTASIFLILIGLGLFLSFREKEKFRTLQTPVFLNQGEVWAQQTLDQMTLEEKIGQFFMVATWSNKSEAHQQEIENLVRNEKIGGLIYFQGSRADLKQSIARFQKISKTPLLIGMDAEWGSAMRLAGEERFPYAYTIGAANDTELTERIGAMMAQESRELGIHINFAPVADVNSNPTNPVIGFRAFGEDPDAVAKHVGAMVRGMEANGVMTSIKHFPGHGDTDKDSHFELPTVSHTTSVFNAIDFKPFRAGIKAGASTVMIGHLQVPALDNSGTPSSLSKKVIQGYLHDSLGFKGLVISDALNMKAVAEKYGKTEVVVKAFEAGCDILLYPESVSESISAIAQKVQKGAISEKDINARCLKVLKAKYHALHPSDQLKQFTAGEIDWAKKEVYEKALTLIRNDHQLLPLTDTKKRIARVSIGSYTYAFRDMVNQFMAVDHYHFYSVGEAIERMKGKLDKYDIVLTAFHASTVRTANQYGMMGNPKKWLDEIPAGVKSAVVLFGNPHAIADWTPEIHADALVIAYENHPLVQDRAAQLIFGATGASGKLSFQVSDFLSKGKGITLADADRLKFSQPEELGISSAKLAEIDAVVANAIRSGAFPGCQVFVAVKGKVIYQKSFGTKTYEDQDSIRNSDIYDLASVTKIASSTAALMRLQTMGKFSLDKKLKDYIPNVTGTGEFGNILLRDMLSHQAGLTPWIAFYKKTMRNNVLSPAIYSTTSKTGFEIPVAENVWISNKYVDSIYQQILSSTLGKTKKYEYSDLGYYFIKKIIEKETKETQDQFVYNELYEPMGLRNINYLPLNHFAATRIVPTENDQIFRGQVIRGYVHDPGAAMMGGVGGHAGLFANSADLGALMQLFLNQGKYANQRYIDAAVIKEYTRSQFPGNRRGAGFDKPTGGSGGPTCAAASPESFGHSGFTGTFAWADPVTGINYVFLSNRVYPDATNWKIVNMHIRTDIQQIIYDAVQHK
jgi:beta-N-acetylhexosaminidase